MDIAHFIAHPETLNETSFHQLRKLVEAYPFYHAARLLLVQNAFMIHHEDYEAELHKAAILLPNREPLFQLAKGKEFEFPKRTQQKKPTSVSKDRMSALIDNYLNQSDGQQRKLPSADPTSDYMNYLFQQETLAAHNAMQYGQSVPQQPAAPQDRTQSLIDQFMSSPEDSRFKLPNVPSPSADAEEVLPPSSSEKGMIQQDCYSESLAKICIRQGRYERAIEIITQIHLNNPRKSAYFADQIRFLQKLAINNKYKS